jgi:hypothetical protein
LRIDPVRTSRASAPVIANVLAEVGDETLRSPELAAAVSTDAYSDSRPLGRATRGANGVGTNAAAIEPSSWSQRKHLPHVNPSST